jgi:peptidyl-tRNA hydrolase
LAVLRLLVGLGNPGPEYEATRHNAGFWWVDAVARKLGATLHAERSYHGLVARINRPAQLGSADYWRLRLGIGHPGVKAEVVDWVLRKPPAEERDAIHACISRSLDALEPMLAGDMERATMKIHAKPPRPKPPKPPKSPDPILPGQAPQAED